MQKAENPEEKVGKEFEHGAEARGGTVVIAHPLGFCAGVERAITTVERALEAHGPPVYVRGEIVHSSHVVARLERRGARFVDSERDVPRGAVCILSAHGVAPRVRSEARRRGLRVIDATCPLVAKVHAEVRRYAEAGRTIVLIGQESHDEVVGTRAEAPERTHVVADESEIDALPLAADEPIAYAVQTTLGVDETAGLIEHLEQRFHDVVGPARDDICYATQNRQAALKSIAASCDVVLVAGARNSSNSNRLVDVATRLGTPGHLVPDAPELRPEWLRGARVVGLTAGASAPQSLVDAILDRLASLGFDSVRDHVHSSETVTFRPPSVVV